MADAKVEAARILGDTRIEAAKILLDTRKEAETIRGAPKDQPVVAESTTNRMAIVSVTQQATNSARPTGTTEPNVKTVQILTADPKLRNQLLPFTTPGNMRLPGMFRAGKTPVSLSQLKAFGALDPTAASLNRLVEIASTPQDSVRPRWKFKKRNGIWQRKANEVQQATAIQQLFIDLGPQVVAAGLLAE